MTIYAIDFDDIQTSLAKYNESEYLQQCNYGCSNINSSTFNVTIDNLNDSKVSQKN